MRMDSYAYIILYMYRLWGFDLKKTLLSMFEQHEQLIQWCFARSFGESGLGKQSRSSCTNPAAAWQKPPSTTDPRLEQRAYWASEDGILLGELQVEPQMPCH